MSTTIDYRTVALPPKETILVDKKSVYAGLLAALHSKAQNKPGATPPLHLFENVMEALGEQFDPMDTISVKTSNGIKEFSILFLPLFKPSCRENRVAIIARLLPTVTHPENYHSANGAGLSSLIYDLLVTPNIPPKTKATWIQDLMNTFEAKLLPPGLIHDRSLIDHIYYANNIESEDKAPLINQMTLIMIENLYRFDQISVTDRIEFLETLVHNQFTAQFPLPLTMKIRQDYLRAKKPIPEPIKPRMAPTPTVRSATTTEMFAKMDTEEISAGIPEQFQAAFAVFSSADKLQSSLESLDEVFSGILEGDLSQSIRLQDLSLDSRDAYEFPTERNNLPFYIPSGRINSHNIEKYRTLAVNILRKINAHLKEIHGAHLFFTDGIILDNRISPEISNCGIPVEHNSPMGAVTHGTVTHLFQIWAMLLHVDKESSSAFFKLLTNNKSALWVKAIDQNPAGPINHQNLLFHTLMLSMNTLTGNFFRLIYEITLYEQGYYLKKTPEELIVDNIALGKYLLEKLEPQNEAINLERDPRTRPFQLRPSKGEIIPFEEDIKV